MRMLMWTRRRLRKAITMCPPQRHQRLGVSSRDQQEPLTLVLPLKEEFLCTSSTSTGKWPRVNGCCRRAYKDSATVQTLLMHRQQLLCQGKEELHPSGATSPTEVVGALAGAVVALAGETWTRKQIMMMR
jgi:hypothetical protein